jgi:hypothetical protein
MSRRPKVHDIEQERNTRIVLSSVVVLIVAGKVIALVISFLSAH